MQYAFFGCNFYGKGWETKSFHLSSKDIAFDARQSGYQIFSVLFGSSPIAKMTGIYGEEAGDIYTEAFAECLATAFGTKKGVDRSIAKKPAQMLIYMASVKSVLLEDDDGQGSIYAHLGPKDEHGKPDYSQLDGYVFNLDIALRDHEVLAPIMEVVDLLRQGEAKNKAVPHWQFPNGSVNFFSKHSTSFLDWGKSYIPIWNIKTDNGHSQMSMHVPLLRAQAKSSAILAAIFHSIDAYIKKQVSIDVWAAGGKILVKHDEYIVDYDHRDRLIKSYHKWLAYIGRNRKVFLEKALWSAGYKLNVDAFFASMEERYGKFELAKVANSTEGLKFEFENQL
jgi:hypothetical protein